jgi:transposase
MRLTDQLRVVALALGGEAGARVVKTLHMAVSADTLLRIICRSAPLALPTPRVLGVDDWAWRKGRVYGTLLVDLEQHHVIDLLPDRTADTLATWLRRHPGVEIISRDRSTEYARGASEGAPEAVQVIDRWHLIKNLREAVERLLDRLHGRLRALPPLPASSSSADVTPALAAAYPRSRAEDAARQGRRDRREALYQQIKTLHAEGRPIRYIAQQLGIARGTARRYVKAEVFPERARSLRKPSLLDPYVPHLAARWQAGCENASQLWRELRDQGFRGTRKRVSQWVQLHRTHPPRTGPKKYRRPMIASGATVAQPSASQVTTSPVPGARRLVWLLLKDESKLTDTERAMLQHIRQDADVEVAYGLAQQFLHLVRQRQPTAFEPWLTACLTSGIPDLQTFATGLQREQEAVMAALTLPWSTGQVEGQVNRLKLIKRQGYGRASFDLLRHRVLKAA